MAFILALGGGIALTYVMSKLSDAYNTVHKPISDYFQQSERDSLEKAEEMRRQHYVESCKSTKIKHNEIRTKHGMTIKCDDQKIINNTDYICNVIYVSKTRALTAAEAITIIELENNKHIFASSTIKTIELMYDSDIIVLPLEIKLYHIVIKCNDTYKVLNDNDYNNKNINIKNKFGHLDHESVDVKCKSFW